MRVSSRCQCVRLPIHMVLKNLPSSHVGRHSRMVRYNTNLPPRQPASGMRLPPRRPTHAVPTPSPTVSATSAPSGATTFSEDKLQALEVLRGLLIKGSAQFEAMRAHELAAKQALQQGQEPPPPPVVERIVIVLTGAAGTGKTTLMKEVARVAHEMDYDVEYAAPTGKAASRLKEITGMPAQTLHRMIMEDATEEGICPSCGQLSEELGVSPFEMRARGQSRYLCPKCRATFSLNTPIRTELTFGTAERYKNNQTKTLLIVDESSMIGTEMYANILKELPTHWLILFVGDREQLEPVNDRWGADLANPTVNLTQVHRQVAGNPILDLATRIRTNQNRGNPWQLDGEYANDNRLRVFKGPMTNDMFVHAAKWLATMRKNRADATLITYTNRDRRKLNNLVRRERGLVDEAKRRGTVAVRGDRVVVLLNHYGEEDLMNGEVYIVNAAVNGPDVPARVKDEYGNEETVYFHTVWIQLYPKHHWYLVPDRAFDPSLDFSVRDFSDIFRMVVGKEMRMEKALEREMKRDVPRSEGEILGPKVAQLRNRIRQATIEDAQRAKEVEKITDPLIKANELAKINKTPQAIGDYLAEIEALPRDVPLCVDFGECLTCHKAQGSQWKNVGVVVPPIVLYSWNGSDEARSEAARRWLYTAVTRASENLRIWSE